MTFRAAAPRCPTCLALFEEECIFEARALSCTGCAGVWFDALPPLEPRASSEQPLPCPRCERTLAPGRVASAEALVCAFCHGVFLPRASFDALLEEPRREGTMPPAREDHVRILAVVRAISRRLPLPNEHR